MRDSIVRESNDVRPRTRQEIYIVNVIKISARGSAIWASRGSYGRVYVHERMHAEKPQNDARYGFQDHHNTVRFSPGTSARCDVNHFPIRFTAYGSRFDTTASSVMSVLASLGVSY